MLINCGEALVHPSAFPTKIVCRRGFYGGHPSPKNCGIDCKSRRPRDKTKPAVSSVPTRVAKRKKSLNQNPVKPAQPPKQSAQQRRGAALWKTLHTQAAKVKTADDLARFKAFIETRFTPALTCSACAAEWMELLVEMPLSDDPMQAFPKTVQWHDAVNVKLKKPVFGFEAATKLYGDGV